MFLKALLFVSLVGSVVLYLKLRVLQERLRMEVLFHSRLMSEFQLYKATLKSTRAHLDQVYAELELSRQQSDVPVDDLDTPEPVMDPGCYLEVD